MLGRVDLKELLDLDPVLFDRVFKGLKRDNELFIVQLIGDGLVPVASESARINGCEVRVPERFLSFLVLIDHEEQQNKIFSVLIGFKYRLMIVEDKPYF